MSGLTDQIDRAFNTLHRAHVARQVHAAAVAVAHPAPPRAEGTASTFPCPECRAVVNGPPPPPSGARFGQMICLPAGHMFFADPVFSDDHDSGGDAITMRVRQDTWLDPREGVPA